MVVRAGALCTGASPRARRSRFRPQWLRRPLGVVARLSLECDGGRLVIRIAVRMILHRKLAIGRFQVLLVGVPRDTKDFVIITLAHAVQARNAGCGGQAESSPKSCPAI